MCCATDLEIKSQCASMNGPRTNNCAMLCQAGNGGHPGMTRSAGLDPGSGLRICASSGCCILCEGWRRRRQALGSANGERRAATSVRFRARRQTRPRTITLLRGPCDPSKTIVIRSDTVFERPARGPRCVHLVPRKCTILSSSGTMVETTKRVQHPRTSPALPRACGDIYPEVADDRAHLDDEHEDPPLGSIWIDVQRGHLHGDDRWHAVTAWMRWPSRPCRRRLSSISAG